jgi:hypothetical protein
MSTTQAAQNGTSHNVAGKSIPNHRKNARERPLRLAIRATRTRNLNTSEKLARGYPDSWSLASANISTTFVAGQNLTSGFSDAYRFTGTNIGKAEDLDHRWNMEGHVRLQQPRLSLFE